MLQRSSAPGRSPSAKAASSSAAVVATTVAAAAATLTAFAAPASAAPGNSRVWDRVASCESSNNWQINTGNGYYGGLQFSASTWALFGGHHYAAQADQASRVEQIEVARRVLAEQGPHAWPVCSIRAGLTRTNGAATSTSLPAAAGARTSSRTAASQPRASHRTYGVRPGDTLSGIAARYDVAGGWQALWRLNRAHLPDPNLIRVGQVLVLP